MVVSIRKMLCGVLGLVMATALAGSAWAGQQDATITKPERRIVDALGIDIADGLYVKENAHLTVGDPASGGLSWRFIPGAQSYSGNVVEALTGSNRLTTVKFEGNATVFINNGTSYLNASGTGATLTRTASTYVFTDDSGTIYTYGWTYSANTDTTPATNAGPLLSLQHPDGTVITITGATLNGAPATVVSNRGYALKTVNNSGVTTIYGVNLSAHICDAAITCDGYDGWITRQIVTNPDAPATFGASDVEQVTDANGNSWQYEVGFTTDITDKNNKETFGAKALWYYKSPDGYYAKVLYDYSGRITSFTDPRGVFTFDYNGQTPDQAVLDPNRTVTVKDPASVVMYSAYAQYKHSTIGWVKDGLGNQTTYTFVTTPVVVSGVGSGSYTRLMSVTKPEGNSVSYVYDGRGNVTAMTVTPKPGSGLSATTVNAGYDASCSSLKTCNKPNWIQDARGQYTYYGYDGTHGGLTSVTSPADQSGITPKTVTSYAQSTAQTKATGGGMVNAGTIWLPQTVSTCATAVTCDGTVNQLKTTTAYATYNLLPSSVTTAAGNGSLSVTTSYTYDAVGNVVMVDGPRTDVDDASYTTYDALRRPVYEIGPDPDGSGALKRMVSHHADRPHRLRRWHELVQLRS